MIKDFALGIFAASVLVPAGSTLPAVAQELIVVDQDGGTYSEGNAVSADGRVVVGTFEDDAAIWTVADGVRTLEYDGFASTEAFGVSADGSVIVGQYRGEGGLPLGFIWTEQGGMADLGVLNGGDWVEAYDVSDDGTVVVGYARDGDLSLMRAFRWTDAGGMVSLGSLCDTCTSFGYGVSGDGQVVVGSTKTATSYYWVEPFRWTEAGGMELLGKLSNGDYGVARAASYDGSVIVGEAYEGAANNDTRAFRWTEETGMVSLGVLNEGTDSFAYDVSGDGLVVVGTSRNGAREDVLQGFRWTGETGMQTVEDWLRDNGATIAEEITAEANGTNSDGSVVVGLTNTNQMFVARVVGDDDGGSGGGSGGGTGMITVDDLNASLSSTATAAAATVQGINTTLNGLGSRPLDRRAPAGKAIFWASGDIGIDSDDRQDGSFGLGEIGLGYNFGPVQLNAAGGFDLIRQDTLLGGGSDVNTGFMKLEAFSRLYATKTGGLWAVVTGVGMWGDAEFRRNYVVNGGLIDNSTGNSGVAGYGVRGRLQWENALPWVSPYGEIAYAHSCVDGYVEKGGAFPASFNRVCDAATEARIGFDATIPVNEMFRLTGTLEGVHRFDSSGGNVSGQVIGLGGFNFAQPGYDQNWLRAGVGFEVDIAGSTLSMMVNGTTSGEAPDGWIAMNWRKTF